MSYLKILAALLFIGNVSVYAETTSEKPKPKNDSSLSEIASEVSKKAKKEINKEAKEETKEKTSSKAESDPETKSLQKIKQKLSLKNTLRMERLKNENADLLADLQKLKWEKEIISEQLALKELKRKRDTIDETTAYEDKLVKLQRESTLEKEKVAKLSTEFDAKRLEWDLKKSKLAAEIEVLKVEKKREAYVDSKPVYLDNPLKDDNTLVISDRRIALNGTILPKTADYIATRINYYNNKDSKKPIFLVIDSSSGGSVMAGYRILKAIHGSRAPVYVVLKSYAASMAATIVTLAKHSFAYPNAVMLHHQISSTFYYTRLNLTQQKEFYTESKKWWERLAQPIAKKMGITTEEFIKKMYDKSSDGDWSEFASDAQKLHWVNHIIDRIEETSLLKDPNSEKEIVAPRPVVAEGISNQKRSVVYLPRLAPKDMYFLYNPNNYYQLK